MKIGVLCEESGTVRDAFLARGHDAISCDILPTRSPGPHIQGDVLDQDWSDFDLLVCHPPCTRLCNSGVRWLAERNLWAEMEAARSFFMACLDLCRKVGKGVVENPIPHKHAKLPPYTQIIQPWQHGHAESKATCLWLVGLPSLTPTNIVRGDGRSIHRCPPGPGRSRFRSTTFPGIAAAMAEQWGNGYSSSSSSSSSYGVSSESMSSPTHSAAFCASDGCP